MRIPFYFCPECGNQNHSAKEKCWNCKTSLVPKAGRSHADSVRCSALVLLHARWLDEARIARAAAKRLIGTELGDYHDARAATLRQCAEELEGAGMKENDPKLSDRRSGRGTCRWVERRRWSAAGAVTAEPVRCSAWFGDVG